MAPRSEAEFERIRNESRKKIISAALELFARNGYSQTTIEAIAKRAGVAKGLIYNYFDNKETLLHETFLFGFQGVEDSFASLVNVQDPCEIVEFFIDGVFDVFLRDIDMWRLQSGILLNPETPLKFRELILQKIDEYTRFIRQTFEMCGVEDSESEAWVFAATLDGVMLYSIFWGDRLPLDGCRNVLKKRYRQLITNTERKEKK